jgi:hypothetical protein
MALEIALIEGSAFLEVHIFPRLRPKWIPSLTYMDITYSATPQGE